MMLVSSGLFSAATAGAQSIAQPKVQTCAAMWNTYAPLPLTSALIRSHPVRAVLSTRLVIGGARCSITFDLADGRRMVSSTPCRPDAMRWSALRITAGHVDDTLSRSARVSASGRIVL
jgi:hypothetical protein